MNTARRSRNQKWQAVGQVGYLRADCLSAQPGVSPAVLRSSQSERCRCGLPAGWVRERGWYRRSHRASPGWADWAIGPQVSNLPHTTNVYETEMKVSAAREEFKA